jgi:hypothetical protein
MKTLLTSLAALLACTIATARAGTFSTAAWTDDASSGIDPGHTVWAYHFASTTPATVNGFSVTGVAGLTVSNANFDLAGMTNVFPGDTNNVTGTGSTVMAQNFVYGGNPATVTVKGLTSGRAYIVSFFSVGWQSDGGDVDFRNLTFTSGADSQLVRQSQFGSDNGIPIDYAFIATAATRGITIAVANGNNATFHLYGLALHQSVLVSTTADTGAGSLRKALTDAATYSGADIISFAPGFTGPITLGSELVINDATGGVIIDAGLLGATIIGGTGTNRIFTVSSGKSLTLLGLTLTGGNGGGADGGAILNHGTLALTRCTLSGNFCDFGSGGAILNDGGALTLTLCTLSGNQAGNHGGAIFNQNGALTLTHCTISDNWAGQTGGGIFNLSGALTLANSIVAGNTALQSANIEGSPPVERRQPHQRRSHASSARQRLRPHADDGPAPRQPRDRCRDGGQ